MTLNHQLLLWFHNLANKNEAFDALVVFMADKLDIIIIGIIALWLLFVGVRAHSKSDKLICFRCYEPLIVILGIGFVARGVAEVIKIITHMPRPFIELAEQVQPLFMHGGFDSFPSGHATFFFAMTVGVYRFNKKWGIVMLLFAIVISLSRIISGVHYPIDILAGAGLGLIVGAIILAIDKWIIYKNNQIQ